MAEGVDERSVEDMMAWFDERNAKRNRLRQEMKNAEEKKYKEECSFNPKINEVSSKIVGQHFSGKSVVERMDLDARKRTEKKKDTEKKIKDRIDEENPHSPQINKRSQEMEISIPVHQRLYEHGYEIMKERTIRAEQEAELDSSLRSTSSKPNTPSKSLAYGKSNDPLASPSNLASKRAEPSKCSTKFDAYILNESLYGIELPYPLRTTHSFSGGGAVVNFVPFMTEFDDVYCYE